MAATRIHHALPAPVVHAGFSVPQSKSHVLAGVQDAYWSDDEAEDADCPLCLEEMDISDLNFKPCVCGYQICRFCWHHIKENLNKRCPACRRVYSDETVEFKPIAAQDHKRLTQQKKRRDRERKELDVLGRRQLANVRVVQRNVVYVVGIGPRFAKEELIPTLRSGEYFGQYGKINKILLVKRNSSGGGAPVVGVYITYHRREDAARAITAVDGSPSPGGGREVMRASYGTTKYCMAFLRGVSCSDHSCMNLHEWGDEKDCFTKEDLTTLKHTMKATETRARNVVANKRGDEAEGLPRSAAWGARGSSATTQRRRGGGTGSTGTTRQSRSTVSSDRPTNARGQDRKTAAKASSQASSSRPTTPAPLPPAHPSLPPRPASPSMVPAKPEKEPSKEAPHPSQSPTPSAVAESDRGSQEVAPTSPEPRPRSADSVQSSIPSVPSVPPGLPSVPPGLSAPPGLPGPRPPRVATASPQTPLLAHQTTYQMSNAARALLDDVRARRESLVPSVTTQSPFPDFDRTLQNLSQGEGGFGGFSFNLDPRLAGEESTNDESLPDFQAEAGLPFNGTFLDAFPALRTPGTSPPAFMTPPGLAYPHNPNHSIYDPLAIRSSMTPIERQSPSGSNYVGSFNPFADSAEETASASAANAKPHPLDDDSTRKVSRFGFARNGTQRSNTASNSPLPISSTPSTSSNNDASHSFLNHAELSNLPAQSQWSLQGCQEFGYAQPAQPNSAMASPLVQQAQAHSMFAPPPSTRFQPFESNGLSEAQLRDFIQSASRDRVSAPGIRGGSTEPQGLYKMASSQQPFTDPAIMSASRFTGGPEAGYMPVNHSQTYGPPPGLTFPPGLQNANVSVAHIGVNDGNAHGDPRTEPEADDVPILSSSDFPALSSTIASEAASTVDEPPAASEAAPSEQDAKAQEKAERKAAKKAAAAAKAAERQRIAQEKAAAKAAEKARIAQEKAAEKEKAAALKAQQEKEKAEKERAKAEREKERAAKAERIAQAEREKAAQAEKEKAAKKAAKTAEAQKIASKRADSGPKASSAKPVAPPEPVTQVPLLSKKPKKNKPITKPIRVPKEEEHVPDENSTVPSATASEPPLLPATKGNSSNSSNNNSRAQSVERHFPTSLEDLMEEIHVMNPAMDLPNHPFFDLHKINPAAKMPLEYGPLVHALSALSVGGGSFANNVPSRSIDNAVSSFQQLLETLTQTISDLLRLLPRTTWDDSSSFDGVLRDMLKGDDFLDEGGEDGHGREDEVAALTLALERRARWMEVQLSKLEELHRDINTAAVRAVLAFNDSGWDRHGFLPRVGNTVRRFDSLGIVEESGSHRLMTADELEKKLEVAKEAAVFAETELWEMMEKMQAVKPFEDEL